MHIRIQVTPRQYRCQKPISIKQYRMSFLRLTQMDMPITMQRMPLGSNRNRNSFGLGDYFKLHCVGKCLFAHVILSIWFIINIQLLTVTAWPPDIHTGDPYTGKTNLRSTDFEIWSAQELCVYLFTILCVCLSVCVCGGGGGGGGGVGGGGGGGIFKITPCIKISWQAIIRTNSSIIYGCMFASFGLNDMIKYIPLRDWHNSGHHWDTYLWQVFTGWYRGLSRPWLLIYLIHI